MSAACLTVRPAKNLSFTISALRGCCCSSFLRASSSPRMSLQPSGAIAGAMASSSIRALSPPRLRLARCRARSIKIRRIDSAAAEKKCLVLSQCWGVVLSTSRTKASCTNAVAWIVIPGFSFAIFEAASFRSSA